MKGDAVQQASNRTITKATPAGGKPAAGGTPTAQKLKFEKKSPVGGKELGRKKDEETSLTTRDEDMLDLMCGAA